MAETTLAHWLNCPCCGEDVLGRATPCWYEDEEEKCSDCGCMVTVRVDEEYGGAVAWTVASEDCGNG